jgi:peptide/nickel transport system substrate-binding protein
MSRVIRIVDDKDRIEHAHLRNAQAAKAITQFRDGEAELVLGGTYVDLPLVPRRERSMRNALHFDPVAGLFGLVPARSGGPLADKELRSLLSRGLNRDALVGAFDVPNLVGRTTVLQAGLEGGANPVPPAWTAVPFEDRYPQAVQEARRAIGDERIRLAVDLPEGRGSEILFARLAADWQPLGIDLVRAGKGVPADLKLVDQVAPSTSPAWFVRSFRCGVAPICSEGADNLMNAGRDTKNAVERAALLAEAGRIIDEEILFIPIAAPVRWSLVGDLPGFAENIFARHPLSGLRDQPIRERQ